MTQWAARNGFFGETLALTIYSVAFFFAMVSLNFAYTAAASLVPDLVPPEQTGMANGIVSLAQVAGSFFGFLFYFVVDDLNALYALYVLTSFFAATFTIVAAAGVEANQIRRQMSKQENMCNTKTNLLRRRGVKDDIARHDISIDVKDTTSEKKKLALAEEVSPIETTNNLEMAHVFFSVSPSDPASADFFWVWISRTLYYLGGSTNSFLQFFLRDRLTSETQAMSNNILKSIAAAAVPPDDPARATCGLALAGYVAGGLAAVPSGALSDRVGRKPLVVISCFFMIFAVIGLAASSSPDAVLLFAIIGGFGNGIYQAVDLALAVDTLPDPQQAAMYMGIWGIGAFIGASLGPAIGGPLLIIAGRLGKHPPPPPQNSELGYLCLFSYGSLCFFASAAILLYFVKKAS